jgi:pimeloyl-ACP methyl ester carboxylesterase
MPFVERDGLRFFYEREGSGTTELVFVPGWCCDGSAFAPQFEHFKTSCTVTTIDLRGCGQTSRPDDGYDIPSLADDVAHVCSELGIERAVFVGHSLGGMIGVELAARHPTVPRALVLVDPGPIDPLPSTVRLFESFAEQLAGPSGEDVRSRYVRQMGARDDDLAQWIADLMCGVSLPIATAVIRGVSTWNGVGAFGLCFLPVLLMRCWIGEDTDVLRLRALKPDLQVGITVGAGHFHQLEVPGQVNAMIERFLEDVA